MSSERSEAPELIIAADVGITFLKCNYKYATEKHAKGTHIVTSLLGRMTV